MIPTKESCMAALERIASTPGVPKDVYNIAADALCWARKFEFEGGHEAQARKLAEAEAGKPFLIYDPETRLYGIMLDHVQVYDGLDPVGRREEIRHKAGVEIAREQGLRLVPPATSRAGTEGT